MTIPTTRILIIDDDQDIWKAYQLALDNGSKTSGEHLRQLGALLQSGNNKTSDEHQFELSFAGQGKEGCDMASAALEQGTGFAIAFVDVRMPPGWDGMKTAAFLNEIDPDIEIVIVTAYSDRSCDEIVKAVGSPHKVLFLRKPFDPEELKRLTSSLAEKWHMARDEEARQRELQTLLCTSPAAIFSIDETQKMLTWNQASAFITGYDADEVIGQKCIFRKIAEDPSCKSCTTSCSFEEQPQEIQFAIHDKNGARKIISMSIAYVPATKGRPAKSIGSFWNISELRESQEKLSSVNRQLQQEIEEKDRLQQEQINLERKLHQAQKMEALGLMAGGVAHDLNNILSSLVGYPEILLMQLPEDSKFREPIETISDAGKRAAAVVSDLLTIARGVKAVRETVSLNDLVTEYLKSPEGSAVQTLYPGIQIRTYLREGEVAISCSSVHVKKCIMNLLTNAAEAIATTGSIDISTSRMHITGAEAEKLDVKEGNYVVLSISDSGPGISHADLERIFEPFYTKKSMGTSGTGLGLTVVWNTMQDHRGTVTIDSSEKGTNFTLYFPASEVKVSAKKIVQSIEELSGKGSILVVDDERQQRDILVKMLSILGYSATAVKSGEEAVAFLQENSVELVLLDMIMPGMNGRETYERINEIRPGQKALFVSGYSRDEEMEKAMMIGVDGFLSKPFTLEQIGLAVQEEMKTSPENDPVTP